MPVTTATPVMVAKQRGMPSEPADSDTISAQDPEPGTILGPDQQMTFTL